MAERYEMFRLDNGDYQLITNIDVAGCNRVVLKTGLPELIRHLLKRLREEDARHACEVFRILSGFERGKDDVPISDTAVHPT